MKQFFKVVVWIVIIGAVFFGVYTVLPEYPQNFVKSVIQPFVDGTAKIRINQIKSLPNKDMNANYETILESKANTTCWVYETREEEPGIEYVIFYGRGVAINLKEWADYQGKLSTSATVKIEFKIIGNNVDIYPYVDGVKMNIEDGKHVEQNDKIKLDIFKQLYSGMQTD